MDHFIHQIQGVVFFKDTGKIIYSKFYVEKYSRDEEAQKKIFKILYEKRKKHIKSYEKVTGASDECLIQSNSQCHPFHPIQSLVLIC